MRNMSVFFHHHNFAVFVCVIEYKNDKISFTHSTKTWLNVKLNCHNIPIFSCQCVHSTLTSPLVYRHFSHLLNKNVSRRVESTGSLHLHSSSKPCSAKVGHCYAGHETVGSQVHFIPKNRNYSCSFLMLHCRL